MKKLISGILTLALAVSMMTFTVSANTSPVAPSFNVNDYVPAETASGTTVKSITGLTTAGAGWGSPWNINCTKIWNSEDVDFGGGTNQHVIKTGPSNDSSSYYFTLDSRADYDYYRALATSLNTAADGVHYVTFTMANAKGYGGNISGAVFTMGTGASEDDAADGVIRVAIENQTASSNSSNPIYLKLGETFGKQLTKNVAYDFLVKIVTNAAGTDEIAVEAVEHGAGFTGKWDLIENKELGGANLSFLGFSALSYCNDLYFKSVAVKTYSAEHLALANTLVSGASKNDFLTRIAQLDTTSFDAMQKIITKAAIKAEAGINAYDYLDFPEVTTDGVSLIGSETYRNGGEGWRSGWTTGTSVSAATGTQGNRNLKKVGDKNYISLDANEVFVRRWFNNISTATDGKYAIDCTLMLYSNAMNPSGTAAGPIVYIGEGDSDMAEKISFGIHGNDINNRASGLPFLKVGDTTVWGTRAMTSTSGAFKFSLEITIDADGAETFNLKVAQLGNNYTDNFANLTVTDSTNFANTNLSYMELKSPAFGGSKFADFVIYEKKNILSIGYPRFYQNGAEVSKADLTNAPVTVKINVDNTTNTPVTGKLLMGAYSGAQMVGCAISPSTFSFAKGQSGVAELTYTPSEDVTLSSDNGLTVFMWNNLTPIMAKESIR